MDPVLHCNSLACRRQLNDRAVVTTCSHIFCEQCSNSLGLFNSTNGVRICPACDTQLSNPDDAVLTTLSPAEDYKTSVLSGLSPSVIMECASRGIAFFQYQMVQEMQANTNSPTARRLADEGRTYQDYLAKNLADKYGSLNSQMDNLVANANHELSSLRDKLAASVQDRKVLEAKNAELAEAFKEKSRAMQRLQTLYQKLKGRVSAVQVEDAAAHDVENVIHAMTGGNDQSTGHVFNNMPQKPRGVHTRPGSGSNHSPRPRPGSGGRAGYAWENQGLAGRYPPQNNLGATPAVRERLNVAQYGDRPNPFGEDRNNILHGPNVGIAQPTPARHRLGPLDVNMAPTPRMNGVGMSAGVKVGRQNDAGLQIRGTPAMNRGGPMSILGLR